MCPADIYQAGRNITILLEGEFHEDRLDGYGAKILGQKAGCTLIKYGENGKELSRKSITPGDSIALDSGVIAVSR